jgi:hypothetical protein
MHYLLLFEEKEKKIKRRNGQVFFFSPGQILPSGCAMPGFPQLLGTIKSVLRVSP